MSEQQPPQTICERRMEEAMRAMDEFVIEETTVNAVYKSPATKLREMAASLDREAAARKLWEEVKKECWRKP